MKLKVSHEAIADIAEIKKYKLLKTSPYIGTSLNAVSAIESDYRYLVCGRYIIFYRILEDFAEVSRVIDGRRDYMRVLFGVNADEPDDTDSGAGDLPACNFPYHKIKRGERDVKRGIFTKNGYNIQDNVHEKQ